MGGREYRRNAKVAPQVSRSLDPVLLSGQAYVHDGKLRFSLDGEADRFLRSHGNADDIVSRVA